MKKRAVELHFPAGGVVRRHAYQNQAPYTTPDALNVRPESVSQLRYTGGTRPGLAKAFTAQLGSESSRAIRLLTTITHVASHTLKTRVVAGAGGKLFYEQDDGTFSADGAISWSASTPPADSSQHISTTNLIHAVDMQQKLYIADWDADPTVSAADRCPKVYSPNDSLTEIAKLVASVGTVPTGCPCVASYRGRLVLAGASSDPHQWYMSRIGDPTDYDYAPDSIDDPAAAVSGSVANAYKVGEPITALISTTDSCLIFGCPTSLWILRGDPRDGGEIHNLSNEVGIVSHGAWCSTPENVIVFLSHDGLYMSYGGCDDRARPESLSRERVPKELLNLSRATNLVTLAYDTFSRGIHIFVTSVDGTQNTHWYFDWENRGFWPVKIPANMQPTALHARRDYAADESVVLLGSSDGYVRWYRTDQATDDGTAIDSYLYYGPLGFGRSFNESGLDEILSVLATDSGDIDWSLYAGSGPQEAFEQATPRYSGTWTADRWNNRYHPRVSGSDFYVKIAGHSNAVWAIERLGCIISERGAVRR